MDRTELAQQVRAALESETEINLRNDDITVDASADGTVTLSGEVEELAIKRVARYVAARVPGVTRLVDHITVHAAEQMGDAEIRDHVRNALLSDSAFHDFSIRIVDGGGQGRIEVVREVAPEQARGDILIRVHEAVVHLQGKVWSLSHRRLAEVFAWWVPGSIDVINELEVTPEEADGDNELADAVHLTLEKDRLVSADQLSIRAEGGRIILGGLVPSTGQREMAEHDAWCVPGVQAVENQLMTP